jgi:mRNA interferase MazF
MDIPLADWAGAGLRRASTVRLSRLDCLEQSLFLGRIGTISPADAHAIKQAWTNLIKPQF